MTFNKVLILSATILTGSVIAGCSGHDSKATDPGTLATKQVSGPLKKVGTYTKDYDSGTITLLAIKNYHNRSVKTKSATYYFKDAKLLKIETNRPSQREDDANNFGKTLSATYYEYQLEYTLQNNRHQCVTSNGVELITPQGTQQLSNRGAIDGLLGETIPSGHKRNGILQAVAQKNAINQLSKYHLVSAELTKNSGNHATIDVPTTISLK